MRRTRSAQGKGRPAASSRAECAFATVERGLNQILTNLGWGRDRCANYTLDVGIAHHVREPIGAEQELIIGLQGLDEIIYFHAGLFTEAAINGFPSSRIFATIAEDPDRFLIGADKFFWASDFPHPDHAGNYIEEVEEMAEKLTAEARRKVLGANVMKVYGCA